MICHFPFQNIAKYSVEYCAVKSYFWMFALSSVISFSQVREDLSKMAKRKTALVLWGGLAYMSIQFGVLARLTWWEYSWDIMEPVTYFVTYGTSMALYAYFVLTRQVSSSSSLSPWLVLEDQMNFTDATGGGDPSDLSAVVFSHRSIYTQTPGTDSTWCSFIRERREHALTLRSTTNWRKRLLR